MARPKKTTAEIWYDVFSDADVAEQATMLQILNEIHGQARRGVRKNGCISVLGCPDCGTALAPSQTGDSWFCPRCYAEKKPHTAAPAAAAQMDLPKEGEA